MKVTVQHALLILSLTLTGRAQTAAPQSAPAAAQSQSAEDEGDRYHQLRVMADASRANYEKISAENDVEIEKALKTKRCQDKRIDSLLNKTTEVLDAWLAQEKLYWDGWNDSETIRVESQKKSLALIGADRERAGELLESSKDDHEELLRKKANLEKSPRTVQIAAAMDALISDLQANETRLVAAQKTYDDLTSQFNNMNASLTERLMQIRQNVRQLEEWRIAAHEEILSRHKAAQEICNTKQPDTKTPLPKAGGGRGGNPN